MRKLTKEDIYLKNVNTIKQFKVLDYLKKQLDINAFDLYLYDNKTIKVIDQNGEIGYFKYDDKTKNILFKEDIEKEKEIGFWL